MNIKHTPGPWFIERLSRWHDGTPQSFDFLQVVSNTRKQLSLQQGADGRYLADANLIASAPDLLQVVEDYVLLCDLHDYVGAVPDAARAALRKAKGES